MSIRDEVAHPLLHSRHYIFSYKMIFFQICPLKIPRAFLSL